MSLNLLVTKNLAAGTIYALALFIFAAGIALHSTATILLAMLLGSIWDFYATISRRLAPTGIKKPLPLPLTDRLSERMRRIFLEVLLQTRVIRDRPMVGIAHALVMWGFFAFALVSAEHLWLGFTGFPQKDPEKTWYGAFAAFWACAVLISIAALSWRRFVRRPKILGALSKTSAVIAGLIASLMATYLCGWTLLAPPSTAWKVNWWLHTASLLAILVVVPKSKHLHLVLAPVAIFYRPFTTSKTRELLNDDDMGMVRFEDISRKDILDINACVECGRCTEICPANRSGQSLNPKLIILDMQHGLHANGTLIAGSPKEKADGSAYVSETDLFQCLSCGACEVACPVGIEHVGSKILDLRRGLVSEGRVSNEKVAKLFKTMERSPHNPWGISQEPRSQFIEKHAYPLFDSSQEWLFWLGCGLNYDPHGQEVALAMKKIFESSGVTWGVLERETCCGEPARRAGNEYLYLELSETLIESFRKKRVKNIISCCPHCTTMLDNDYRQRPAFAELGINVLHHSEFIAEVLPNISLVKTEETFTFHDPCYLARDRGIHNQPREILHGCGVTIHEMAENRTHTSCCGAGGAQLFIADDSQDEKNKRINHLRFAQVLETKATAVAVACPYCPIMLKDAANHAKHDTMPILDIAEIVASRISKEAQ